MTATISAFAVSQIPTEPHRTKVTTGLSDKYKRKGMWRVYVNHYQLLGKSACTKTKRLEKTPKILENLKIRWRPLFFLDFLVKTDNRPEWQVQRKSMRACLCQSLSIVWKVCFLWGFKVTDTYSRAASILWLWRSNLQKLKTLKKLAIKKTEFLSNHRGHFTSLNWKVGSNA